MAKKWLDSIEKQKRKKIDLKFAVTDGDTDRQSQRKKIIRLLG